MNKTNLQIIDWVPTRQPRAEVEIRTGSYNSQNSRRPLWQKWQGLRQHVRELPYTHPTKGVIGTKHPKVEEEYRGYQKDVTNQGTNRKGRTTKLMNRKNSRGKIKELEKQLEVAQESKSYTAQSLFSEAICNAHADKFLLFPRLDVYDGLIDPYEHISSYESLMDYY